MKQDCVDLSGEYLVECDIFSFVGHMRIGEEASDLFVVLDQVEDEYEVVLDSGQRMGCLAHGEQGHGVLFDIRAFLGHGFS